MKNFLFCLLLLAVSCTGRRPAGQADTRTTPKSLVSVPVPATDPLPRDENGAYIAPYTLNDTTFLYSCTWTEKGEPHHIKAFLVRDRDSEPYRQFIRQSTLSKLNPGNAYELECHWKMLKELYPEPLPVHDLDGCPQTWIPLVTFKGKHYVDLLRCDPIWITDSLYIQHFLDGPMPGRLETFEHPAPAHYRLRTVGPAYPEPGLQVDIHIIDPVRQIAVIVFRTDVEYAQLYGALERIDQFDLVDWDVTDLPAGDEITWDEIDCLSLIPQEARNAGTVIPDSTAGRGELETEDTSTEK
ncbi:hypothetical protein [Alistipes sp.]|uniref:hypothetical protein n=1 Tax=Alistipes sp. TaxID=1872444 RepID=UPI003AF0C285